MFKISFISFLLFGSFVLAQTWKNTVNLGISAGSDERIDLYTNSAGNHLLVQSDNQLKYYLYSYNGTLIRSSVIENFSESKRVSSIAGGDGKVYVMYKKGSQIKSKRTANNGVSWSTLYNINMTYSTSNGMDAVADDQSAYMVWSERSSTPNHYETNYMNINHSATQWTDFKQVTDESGKEGGLPSVSLASDRVSVGFTDLDDAGSTGSVYLREKTNSGWQSSSYIWYGIQGSFINDNSKTHLFVYDFGDESLPSGEREYMLSHKYTSIGGSWPYENYSTLYNYGEGNIPDETERANLSVTSNGYTHIVYDGATYKKWNGSQFTDTFTFGNGNNNVISANGNDVYIAWIESGYIRLRHLDANPLIPSGFSGSWDNGNPETGHPRLDWNANTETDLKEYEVWKKVDAYGGGNIEPWAIITTTTNTYYIDNSEIGWEYMTSPRVVYYKIRAVDQANNQSGYTGDVTFKCNNGPHVESFDGQLAAKSIPKEVRLVGNYPNPFNPSTELIYFLPKETKVDITVYDVGGRKLCVLYSGSKSAGYHKAHFNGAALPSGVYYYTLRTGNRICTKRMLLVK